MWRWHTRLLHHLDADSLLPLVQKNIPAANRDFVELIRGNLERAEDALHFMRLLDVQAALSEDAQAVIDGAAEGFYATALQLWDELDTTDWKTWMNAVKEQSGCKGKQLFMPLRVALSGEVHGPEMSSIVHFLGKKGVQERLQDLLAL